MQDVFEILEKIESTSSTSDKIAILQRNRDNESLKQTLLYALNPYYVYGIGSKTFDEYFSSKEAKFQNVFQLLDYLRQHNTGSFAEKELVNNFVDSQPEEYKDWYRRIILKDLRIGCDYKTVNKVWPKLIPSFEVMLAYSYFDYEDHVRDEFILTPKLDGVRAILIKENNNISIISRQGKQFEGMIEIENEAEHLLNNYVYDGELIAINGKSLHSKDLYRETVKITQRDGVKTGLEFHVFDCLPLSQFQNKKAYDPCIERKRLIHDVFVAFDNKLKFLKEVRMLYVGNDKSKIADYLKWANTNGVEGIMVNTADGKYEFKRTKELLKVKSFKEADLRIIGFEEGTGKYEGMLGALMVAYKGNTVKVGTGFLDEDREEIWDNQDKYMGKIATIKYFEESKNSKNDALSLRFPVFMRLRDDKNEADF